MKKIIPLLGAAAALAALTPYRVEKDEQSNTITAQALLWKISARPNDSGRRDLALSFGLHHPENDAMFRTAPEEGEGYSVSIEVTRDEPAPAEEPAPTEEAAE